MQYHLQHTYWAYLLCIVPVLIIIFITYWYWQKKAITRLGNTAPVKKFTATGSSSKTILLFSLLLLAFIAGVLALVNPQKPGGIVNRKKKGIDVMIALDVSKSMLAQDVNPNRLENAKMFINRLINQMPDDRFGLVLFAGKSYLQMPLTADHAALSVYLSAVQPGSVSQQGTVIEEALLLSKNGFVSEGKSYKTILLISDGEDHEAGAVETATHLAQQGVMINAVGAGTTEGSTFTDPETGVEKTDAGGQPVISRLNETTLQEIAKVTNGVYVNLAEADEALALVSRQLSQIETKAYTDISQQHFTSLYPWLAATMLALLLISVFTHLPVKKKKLPVLFSVIFLLTSLMTIAQTSNNLIEEGNKWYRQKDYTKAENAYKKALQTFSNLDIAQFNYANTLMQQNRFDDAITAYRIIIDNGKDGSLKAMAYYNIGVAYSNAEKLMESIEAYKNVLKINPTDEDARQNLQKALTKLKRKQPPPDKEKKDKKEQKEKEDQKKQQQPNPMQQKQAERQLKLLEQKEKELQQRMQDKNAKNNGKGGKKDW